MQIKMLWSKMCGRTAHMHTPPQFNITYHSVAFAKKPCFKHFGIAYLFLLVCPFHLILRKLCKTVFNLSSFTTSHELFVCHNHREDVFILKTNVKLRVLKHRFHDGAFNLKSNFTSCCFVSGVPRVLDFFSFPIGT